MSTAIRIAGADSVDTAKKFYGKIIEMLPVVWKYDWDSTIEQMKNAKVVDKIDSRDTVFFMIPEDLDEEALRCISKIAGINSSVEQEFNKISEDIVCKASLVEGKMTKIDNAIRLLCESGYAVKDENYEYYIDEGLGKILKKARRKIFGLNDKEKKMVADRQKLQKDREEAHNTDKKSKEAQERINEEDSVAVLKRLAKYYKEDKHGENVKPIYEVLVKLYKKYGKKIQFSNIDATNINIYYHYSEKSKATGSGFRSDAEMSKSVSREYNQVALIGFCNFSSANDKFNYEDDEERGKISNFRYATDSDLEKGVSDPRSLTGKTTDVAEWGEKINAIMNKFVNGVSEQDTDEWEEGAHQTESVKVQNALRLLRENGYRIR